MSDKQVAEVVGALIGLPDDKKQFVLGFAAGVNACAEPRGESKDDASGDADGGEGDGAGAEPGR